MQDGDHQSVLEFYQRPKAPDIPSGYSDDDLLHELDSPINNTA